MALDGSSTFLFSAKIHHNCREPSPSCIEKNKSIFPWCDLQISHIGRLLIQNLLNGLSTFDTKPSWGLKRDTEPGIWRFVLGALATFFLDFFKTFGSKKRVRHGISLRSIKKEIQNRLKTKKVRSSQSWSSKNFQIFRKFWDFQIFRKFEEKKSDFFFKYFSARQMIVIARLQACLGL